MNPLATVLVVVLLVSGMFAMGTSTSTDELRRLSRRPAALLLAIVVNLLVIPAAAFALLTVLDLGRTTEIALMVIAAAPGGGTGALLSLHVNGDRAHAVALQVILAVTSLVAAPLWVQLFEGASDGTGEIRLGRLVVALIVFQLLPLLLGLILSGRRPAVAQRLHPGARRFADAMLAALIVVLVVTSGSEIDRNGTDAIVGIAAVLVLTVLGGAAGTGSAAVRRATAMTTLVRNLSLALAATTFVGDSDSAALVVLTYGLAMYLAAVGWVLVARRRVAAPA